MSSEHAEVKSLPKNPEKATLEGKNKFLAFWFFLGGETVLFASLFGVYLALKGSTNGGPTPDELFGIPITLSATLILLTSSLTSVFAMIAMKSYNLKSMQLWLGMTVLLGIAFLGLEIYEFSEYLHEEHGFTTSAFGSAFYTLVGFHGAHVLFGVLWISTLMFQAMKKGINTTTAPKFYLASLYWHFVDVVWVFIFTVVYLMGMMGG